RPLLLDNRPDDLHKRRVFNEVSPERERKVVCWVCKVGALLRVPTLGMMNSMVCGGSLWVFPAR
ncbi:MAG: hypothetical protein QME78_17960, partial [Thermodesulfobacteriota bacterium]|nr:hypothetical protein [Thermodesulfobacteriota bacterium]